MKRIIIVIVIIMEVEMEWIRLMERQYKAGRRAKNDQKSKMENIQDLQDQWVSTQDVLKLQRTAYIREQIRDPVKNTAEYKQLQKRRILISGATLSAYTLALSLQQKGVTCHIVDQGDKDYVGLHGDVAQLGPSSIAIMQKLQVLNIIKNTSQHLTHSIITNEKSVTADKNDYTDSQTTDQTQLKSFPLAFHKPALLKRLHEITAPISNGYLMPEESFGLTNQPIFDNRPIVQTHFRSKIFNISLSKRNPNQNRPILAYIGSQLNPTDYDALILTDGPQNDLRSQIFPASSIHLRSLQIAETSTYVDYPPADHHTKTEMRAPGARLYIVPVNTTELYVKLIAKAEASISSLAPSVKSGLPSNYLSLFSGPQIKPILDSAQKSLSWTKYPIEVKCDKWVDPTGRVALMGLAAHGMMPDPEIEDGMDVEDAWVMGECLGNEKWSIEEGLKKYEEVRKKRVERLQDEAWKRNDKTWEKKGWMRKGLDRIGLKKRVEKQGKRDRKLLDEFGEMERLVGLGAGMRDTGAGALKVKQ
eukprot:TRINITY_DN3834_c0_g1_i2.p1 TRINITY_DN3834_c0_g1~~TRINITY_DN3834_c0_g1_i2.p1  ORF type:complete len:531 (+),score=140.34 TRINITY_DN3834_c0_g1_i2:28-1620(+)